MVGRSKRYGIAERCEVAAEIRHRYFAVGLRYVVCGPGEGFAVTRDQRGMVVSVACDLDERVEKLKSALLSETDPKQRWKLRNELHEFEAMVEKLEEAMKP